MTPTCQQCAVWRKGKRLHICRMSQKVWIFSPVATPHKRIFVFSIPFCHQVPDARYLPHDEKARTYRCFLLSDCGIEHNVVSLNVSNSRSRAESDNIKRRILERNFSINPCCFGLMSQNTTPPPSLSLTIVCPSDPNHSESKSCPYPSEIDAKK